MVCEKLISGTCFHCLSASAESDGVWKASSATFFHRPEAYLHPDGLKNLAPAHFSISQKFNSNLMDWVKASFPRLLHRWRAFHSLAGQIGQVDSIDQEILSAWMEWKAWGVAWRAVVSILAEIISASMVRKVKSGRSILHQPRNLLILDVRGSEKCPNGVHRGRNFLSLDGATSAKVIIAATWRINERTGATAPVPNKPKYTSF